LQDTLAAYTTKITLRLDLAHMDEALLVFLEELFKKHKGDHKLDMTFYEAQEQIKLSTTSRKVKVHVGEDFLAALDDYPVAFKLN